MVFNIYLEEDIETDFGKLQKGAKIETVLYDDEEDIRRYIIAKYLSEDIKVSYKKG